MRGGEPGAPFLVYVRERVAYPLAATVAESKVLSNKDATEAREARMLRAGWTLLWDDAPTAYDGAKYAYDHCRALPLGGG